MLGAVAIDRRHGPGDRRAGSRSAASAWRSPAIAPLAVICDRSVTIDTGHAARSDRPTPGRRPRRAGGRHPRDDCRGWPPWSQPHALSHRYRQHQARDHGGGRRWHVRRFVGGHPMAGGTPRARRLRAPTCSTAGRGSSPIPMRRTTRASAARDVRRGARRQAGRHSLIDGEEHDRLMAAISHLPQVMATR